jgi:hypothetical protein
MGKSLEKILSHTPRVFVLQRGFNGKHPPRVHLPELRAVEKRS